MKLKKAKKIEASLIAALEFVRVTAHINPKATAETLEKMKLSPEVFSSAINRLIKLAVKNTDAIGASVYDVLATLRRESARRKKNGKDTNVYNDDIKKDYESNCHKPDNIEDEDDADDEETDEESDD